MANQRTGGMTTIGILNIVFGALFSLFGLLTIVGGGLLAAGGAGMEEPDFAAAGGIVMLLGVGALAINVLLLVSGIGVLKVAPWGRSLSIAYGGLGVILYGAMLAGGNVGLMTIGAVCYSVLLLVMCFTSTWKAAFSGAHAGHDAHMDTATTPTTTDTTGTDDHREAA